MLQKRIDVFFFNNQNLNVLKPVYVIFKEENIYSFLKHNDEIQSKFDFVQPERVFYTHVKA
jgi:hypothetical protein